MRRICAVDANQGEIVAALLRLGWDVIDAHTFAQTCPGFPDILAARAGVVLLIEVKQPGAKLTPDEETFWLRHADIRGGGFPCVRVESVDDVIALSGGRMM